MSADAAATEPTCGLQEDTIESGGSALMMFCPKSHYKESRLGFYHLVKEPFGD
jgi:hypothetical protein